MSALPPNLRAALATLTGGQKLAPLRKRHDAVSDAYRAGGASSGVIDSPSAVAAYAIARMPATYAACRAALAELDRAIPDFAPASAADLGCGPGTALLAALETYPSIRRATGFDHNRHFLRFAGQLLSESGLAAGREALFQSAELAGDFQAEPADLVIASYALVEMAEAAALALALRLWAQSGVALVLVEPGSQAGFARLKAVRAALVETGAVILAPCTHRGVCPMPEGDWCHFSVRLARSREHRHIKSANVPYEDEKFSYLVAARQGTPAFSARIIAPVVHAKSGHRIPLCDANGLVERTVGTRDADYRVAKKWAWGDGIG